MKHRILIVEDDPLSRELLTDWLETDGYEVMSATDLKTGFDAVQSHPPHLVLLDIGLGANDGLTLACWMRQQPELRQIPIIAVTAHAMVTETQRIIEAGCNAVVPKPVDLPSLQEQLQKWLRR